MSPANVMTADQMGEVIDRATSVLEQSATVIAEQARLIIDLSDCLTDEGANWSNDGLDSLRRRVANCLSDHRCPDWLLEYRDPESSIDQTPEARE